MAGHPSAGELVAAVREFVAGLALEGRDGFHAKVAANVLAIVERELAAPSTVAVFGLSEIDLCGAIRAGKLTVATPGLIDALIVATVARLKVDNPRYSTLARLELIQSNAAVQR
jgi:hypothetical protein